MKWQFSLPELEEQVFTCVNVHLNLLNKSLVNRQCEKNRTRRHFINTFGIYTKTLNLYVYALHLVM